MSRSRPHEGQFLPGDLTGKNRAVRDAKPLMSIVDTPPAPVPGALPALRVTPLRYLVALVAAGSAGVHAALVPEHLREGTALGVAFAGTAIALALVAAVTRTPRNDTWAPAAAAAVLLATAAAYLLSRTTGLPGLITDPEEVDLLGAVTSSAEVVAAAAAVLLSRRDHS
jgi:hypothetical protein